MSEPTLEQVEQMHEHNIAAWRAMIKIVANSEIDFIAENERDRAIAIALANGLAFQINNIPHGVKVKSLATAFEYLFAKLEAFPMAMEVEEL